MPSALIKTTTTGVNLPLLGAGLSGGFGVVLGALGSHAFMPLMDVSQMKDYQNANLYHLSYSIVMMVVAAIAPRMEAAAVGVQLRRANAFFAAGTILMSGSRYIHCTVHKPDFLTKLVPIGRALLGAGWCFIGAACVACIQSQSKGK